METGGAKQLRSSKGVLDAPFEHPPGCGLERDRRCGYAATASTSSSVVSHKRALASPSWNSVFIPFAMATARMAAPSRRSESGSARSGGGPHFVV